MPANMFIPLVVSARALVMSVAIHILREASASLLVLLYRAMRRPLQAERATVMALTLFYFVSILSLLPEVPEGVWLG